MLVRSWNLFHGNSSPPQRRAFLDEMIELVTADRPDVLCVQEVPAWALGRFSVGDLSSRPPLGVTLGRLITAPHHGLIRGAVAGQGLGMWFGPGSTVLDHRTAVLNPRSFRHQNARRFGLSPLARWSWAKERRIAQVVRLSVGVHIVVVVNVHCTGLADDSRASDAELMRAAEFAMSVASSYDVVVLAGDFNVGPARSQALRLLAGPDWGFSRPAAGIDHVLVRGATAVEFRVWPDERRHRPNGTLLSDHAPVELEIALPATSSDGEREH